MLLNGDRGIVDDEGVLADHWELTDNGELADHGVPADHGDLVDLGLCGDQGLIGDGGMECPDENRDLRHGDFTGICASSSAFILFLLWSQSFTEFDFPPLTLDRGRPRPRRVPRPSNIFARAVEFHGEGDGSSETCGFVADSLAAILSQIL